MTILLRGVRLYGEGDEVDIKIDDGQIAAIGAGLEVPGDAEIIDVRGQVLLPGFVDLHTHYDAQLFWDPYCTRQRICDH